MNHSSRSAFFFSLLLALAPAPGWCALTADTGFSGDGFAEVNPTAQIDTAHAAAVQSDNKVILAGFTRVGNSSAFKDYALLVRLNTDGTLDTSFDTDGIVSTLPATAADFGGADLQAVALQSDGKIVVAGWFNDNSGAGLRMLLMRYNGDGSLDTGFSSDGIVIGSPGDPDGSLGYASRAYAVAIDADGKILVAGNETRPGIPYTYPGFIARYTSTGAIDDTFGTGGVFVQSMGSTGIHVRALLVLGDGSIIGGGGTDGGSLADAILVKLASSGAPDDTFGTGGAVLMDGGSNLADQIYALSAATSDGAILAGGQANGKAGIARFLSDGTFDAAYVAADEGPFYAMVGFADGSAVAAGLGIAGRQVAQVSADAAVTSDLAGISVQSIIGLAVDGNGKVVGAGERNVSGVDYSAVAIRMNVTALGGGPDTTPNPFTFTDQGGVALSTTITSAAITVSGIDAAAAISVSGGQYSIDGGAFTSTAGTVTNGQTVQARHTSSASYATTTNTVVTIGGVSDTFTSTTLDAPVPDTTPNAFTFTDVTDADPFTEVFSNIITVSGINAATEISLAGAGSFSIDGGTYITGSSTIANGQTVQIRIPESGNFEEVVSGQLTIGGVSDTFSVTTRIATADTVLDANNQSVGVTTSTGQLMDLVKIATPAFVPSGYTFPSGFFSFSVDNMTPGGTATVTFTLPAGSAPTAWVKCGSSSCALFAGASITGNVVTLTLVDGGAGDSDGSANGQIIDPGAPATTYAPPSNYDDDNWYSGALDGGSLLWLSALGLLGLRRRRR